MNMHRIVRVIWCIFWNMFLSRLCQSICLAPLLLLRSFQWERACFPAITNKHTIWEMVSPILISCTHVFVLVLFQMWFLVFFQWFIVHISFVAYIAHPYLNVVHQREMVACIADRFELIVAYHAQFLTEFGCDSACVWCRNRWLICSTFFCQNSFWYIWCGRIMRECAVFLQIVIFRKMRFADVTQISDFQMNFHVMLLCFGFSCKYFTAC